MELRDYQTDLLARLYQAYDDGYRAPCIVLPCGGGKSIIIAAAAKHFTDNGNTVLFLVHRKELCGQIERTFRRAGVNMELCRIMMVQTMVRRLSKAAPAECLRSRVTLGKKALPVSSAPPAAIDSGGTPPDLIITDENHHSLAATYKRIYAAFPGALRLGVTATPERLDGSGLADVNDLLIEGVTAKWLIENHYLSPYDYYAPNIKTPKFRTRRGDFDSAQVAAFFQQNITTIYGDVLRHYRRLADGQKAICYLPSVAVSQQTAALFSASGISAAHIDGQTPEQERDGIIRNFRDGKVKILCNVDIISEGFDVPDCACVILLRPTKSLTLFIQQAMRCMRYKPEKRAVIIDHVNNISLHGFPDADRQWSLEGHPKQKGEGTAPVKCCPDCFACVPAGVKKCPHCGCVFEADKPHKALPDFQLVRLEAAEARVKFYLTASECQNVDELKAYARMKGYKPGWVYYQQKSRGWLSGAKGRNQAAKRYPCRPV